MLFKQRFLDGIAAGTITLAFRHWRRPTVKAGGRLRTSAGVLAIEAVEEVDPAGVTDEDARRAGFPSQAELLRELAEHAGPPLYRIELRLAGPDPRAELRQQDELSGEELAELTRRLARLDKASRRGPWTTTFLELIRDHPGVRAPELAARVGLDTPPFKIDVRKLKELGLTESLAVGYRLSPRGLAFLARLGVAETEA